MGHVNKPERHRKFIGVLFECCRVYHRIYINARKTAYVGRCPKCLAELIVQIGAGGTDSRFFKAY